MSSDSRPHLAAPWRKKLWLAVLTVAAAAYAAFLVHYQTPYAGGADSSGYFNCAKLIMHGDLIVPMRLPAGLSPRDYGYMVFMPLGLVEHSATELVPSYPPGLPLHMVALGGLIGLSPALSVWNVVFALGSSVLIYALGRRSGLPTAWALVGAVVFLVNPLTIFLAVQPMSDLPAMFWCTLAVFAALRGRESLGWAVFAGFAVGIAVLVRPSNVLLAVPLALALAWEWRKMAAVIVGGLLPAAFQLWYNVQITGELFATGYGDVRGAFAWENLWPSLQNVAVWLPGLLSPLMVIGLVLAPTTPAWRTRTGVVLLGWTVTLVVFYLFYYHTRETWWYLRFIFPMFGALIVLALGGLHRQWEARTSSRPRWALGVALVALVFFAAWNRHQVKALNILYMKDAESRYLTAANWVRDQVPADAAVFCMQASGALYFYTDTMIARWDTPTRESVRQLQADLTARGIPLYAVWFDFEEAEAREKLGGEWTRLARGDSIALWRKEP